MSQLALFISFHSAYGQQIPKSYNNKVYTQIIEEIETNNQLQPLATELLDVIGPRLVGSPEMQQAHDWVIDTYKIWNIKAENIAYGEWKAWQRGTTEVTLTAPRIKTIDAMQLAWNTNTKKPVEAEIITMPVVEGHTYKAFLWKSLKERIPVTKSIKLEK